MPSPFPGMDPYLEDPAFWPDFHSTFINYWREALADHLPDAYEARINERVYLVEGDSRRQIVPDVAVSSNDDIGSHRPASAVATLEPVTIPMVMTEEGPRETFVEILHRPERSLVTILELLSPTNKFAPWRDDYLSKRNAIVRQHVHLVELDLLKGGLRPPLQKPWPEGDCGYLVSRSENRPNSQVYAWSIRRPLPVLPVPLRTPDADVMIDLAAIFTTAYDRGRFARSLRYEAPCPAELEKDDRLWAQEVVRATFGQ